MISKDQFSVEAAVDGPPRLPEFKNPITFQDLPTGTVEREVISFESNLVLGNYTIFRNPIFSPILIVVPSGRIILELINLALI